MRWQLPAHARSASRARQLLREALRDEALRDEGAVSPGRAELADDAVLLVSELVTNAVLHGQTEVTLTLEILGPLLRIGVADGSAQLPVVQPDSPVALGGRGVALVAACAARWGVDRRPPHGKTVWFEMQEPTA